ncbi:MAG: hypothetical protein KDB94_00150 [Acidobacteria bacterium]|nr:hypothetical protein [Acidobacteriota bacterium]MCB9377310.1 hypothetical protein [Holophagales bacterium]
MLEFLHRTLLLHLLLNTSYVAIGMAVGLVVAWMAKLERRFVLRKRYLLRLLLIAVALALLITLLTDDLGHFAIGAALGFLAGIGTAYLSRAQAGSGSAEK